VGREANGKKNDQGKLGGPNESEDGARVLEACFNMRVGESQYLGRGGITPSLPEGGLPAPSPLFAREIAGQLRFVYLRTDNGEVLNWVGVFPDWKSV